MKKKIKDLTLIETNKYCRTRRCENCPFVSDDDDCLLDYISSGYPLEKWFAEVLEREVEVDE